MKSTCHGYALAGSDPSAGSVAVPVKPMVLPAVYVALAAGDVIDAVGGACPTTTFVDAWLVWPPLPTVTVAVKVPFWLYWCDGFAAVETGEPSPKSHEEVSGPPNGPCDPAEESWTVSGASPALGVAAAAAVGAKGPGALILVKVPSKMLT